MISKKFIKQNFKIHTQIHNKFSDYLNTIKKILLVLFIKIKQYSKKIIIISLLTVLFIEFLSRIIIFKTKIITNFHLNNNFWWNNDSWWRIRWLKHNLHDKNDIIQYYSIYRYDENLGWDTKANLVNHDIGDGVLLNTNSVGLRGLKEYKPEKNINKKRIIIIGDSFTFGEEVDDQSNYPTILENINSKIGVLNFAVGGYGHDQMLLKLQTQGLKYNPDIIILGFLPDDMNRNILDFRDYWKPKFTTVNNKLQLVPKKIFSPEEILTSEFFRLKIFDIINILISQINVKERHQEMLKISTLLLDEMIQSAQKISAQIIFVYLATDFEIVSDKISDLEIFFDNFCDQRSNLSYFYCINTRPDFRSEVKNGKIFRNGHYQGHYDKNGHALVANTINEKLIDILNKKINATIRIPKN